MIDDYQQPEIQWTLADLTGANDPDTGDIYSGWDRFGRVKNCRWYDYGSSADAARIQYGYDRAGNWTYRYDLVAIANSVKFDELYGYDAIQRLKDMARGTLNAGKTAISTETFAQCWSLDATGNWQGFREDDNGGGSWDLVQSRSANPVNEITGITNSVGSAWVTPAYSAAGNMTTMPQRYKMLHAVGSAKFGTVRSFGSAELSTGSAVAVGVKRQFGRPNCHRAGVKLRRRTRQRPSLGREAEFQQPVHSGGPGRPTKSAE